MIQISKVQVGSPAPKIMEYLYVDIISNSCRKISHALNVWKHIIIKSKYFKSGACVVC